MKKFLVFVAIFVLGGVLLASAQVPSENYPLKLTIKSNKQTYRKGAPINIEIKFENVGDKPLKINKNFFIHSDLLPSFKSKKTGEELLWLPPPFPATITENSFKQIAPGEVFEFKADRLDKFLTVSQNDGYPKPGEYLIFFRYWSLTKDLRSGKEFLDAWAGGAKSNTVEIEILGL